MPIEWIAIGVWLAGVVLVVAVNHDAPNMARVFTVALLWPLFATMGIAREAIRHTREMWE